MKIVVHIFHALIIFLSLSTYGAGGLKSKIKSCAIKLSSAADVAQSFTKEFISSKYLNDPGFNLSDFNTAYDLYSSIFKNSGYPLSEISKNDAVIKAVFDNPQTTPFKSSAHLLAFFEASKIVKTKHTQVMLDGNISNSLKKSVQKMVAKESISHYEFKKFKKMYYLSIASHLYDKSPGFRGFLSKIPGLVKRLLNPSKSIDTYVEESLNYFLMNKSGLLLEELGLVKEKNISDKLKMINKKLFFDSVKFVFLSPGFVMSKLLIKNPLDPRVTIQGVAYGKNLPDASYKKIIESFLASGYDTALRTANNEIIKNNFLATEMGHALRFNATVGLMKRLFLGIMVYSFGSIIYDYSINELSPDDQKILKEKWNIAYKEAIAQTINSYEIANFYEADINQKSEKELEAEFGKMSSEELDKKIAEANEKIALLSDQFLEGNKEIEIDRLSDARKKYVDLFAVYENLRGAEVDEDKLLEELKELKDVDELESRIQKLSTMISYNQQIHRKNNLEEKRNGLDSLWKSYIKEYGEFSIPDSLSRGILKEIELMNEL